MATLDVEDENILSTIFKDAFPDNWRDNPDFAQYLADLSSYGIDKLGREPDRLSEERTQILEQTQDLAFHNYKTFIQTAECSKEIFEDFQIIESHVGNMLDKLPALTKECETFLEQAQEINQSRRMNNLTLQRHTQLLEILEIPQLMDTCVRNGYYEEALELAAHVKRLEKKHSTIPVIMNIVNDVKSSMQLMLNQLVQQLRSNIQLPACLRVIGYLRRMDAFSEAELRMKFLQARDSWFQSILAGIPTDDAYYHITKVIEASRVHLFDIITQYRAIFSDEDPLLTITKEDSPNESALFHSWVVQKVSDFLHMLETDLSRGVGGRIDSLLGQCMYFGLSFSRVGADFRGLLVPIFQKAAKSGFMTLISEANEKLDTAMQSFTLLGTPVVTPSGAYTMASQGAGQLQPPISLLEFHPLAVYCNDILTAFNELRLCAPVSLASDVARMLQDSLKLATNVILVYHRAEEATFNDQEIERFGRLCAVYCNDLVPYLNKCMQTLFPPQLLTQALGITPADLLRLGNLGRLDCHEITGPISHLVPKAPEPEVQEVTSEETTGETDQSEKISQTDETGGQSEESTQKEENISQSEPASATSDNDDKEKTGINKNETVDLDTGNSDNSNAGTLEVDTSATSKTDTVAPEEDKVD